MANIDNINLWLYSRLENSWQSSRLAPLINIDVIKLIVNNWDEIGDTTLKLKLLPVVFSFNKRQIDTLSDEFMNIINLAIEDKDDWVKTLATLISTVVKSKGNSSINFDGLKNNEYFKETFGMLCEKLKSIENLKFSSTESSYLQYPNVSSEDTTTHFKIKKRRPRWSEELEEMNKKRERESVVKPVVTIKERKEPLTLKTSLPARETQHTYRPRPITMPESKPRKMVELVDRSSINLRESYDRLNESKTVKISKNRKAEDKKRKRDSGGDDTTKGTKKTKDNYGVITTGRFSKKTESTSPLVGNILAQINSLRTNQTEQTSTNKPWENPLMVRTIQSSFSQLNPNTIQTINTSLQSSNEIKGEVKDTEKDSGNNSNNSNNT